MKKQMIINKNNFYNKIYFSRYNFLVEHIKPGNILDLGNIGGVFGVGKSDSFHLRLKEEIKESIIYGFDLFPPKNIEDYSNQKQGNIENGLPYPNNFFDTVYMGELIEHLSNFKFVLAEISRVLKKDGKFILSTPNAYSLMRIVKWIIQREENLGDPTHLILFTPASLASLLDKHHFKIEILSEKSPKAYRFFPFLVKGLGNNILISAKKTD